MKRALGWASLGLAGLPLAIATANLVLLRRPEPAPDRPGVSVLIPARDEEANIEAAVRAVLGNHDVDLELIVLDDGSTDRTAAILAAIDDPRLVVMSGGGALPAGWSGKQYACARLAERATRELMVFVDADVRLAPDALSRLAGFMRADAALGLASGVPRQITVKPGEWLLLPLIHLLLLGYRPIWLDREQTEPGFAAGCGQLFIARRDAYRAMGGHATIRNSKHDGLTLPRAFRRAGFATGLLDATELASCRMYQDWPTLWSGLGKNATEGMATPAALPVWSVLLFGGHVLPFLLVLFCGTRSGPATVAAASSLGLRLMLMLRFRHSLAGALSQPLGVMLLLIRQWSALLDARAGRPTQWRGRTYPP